MILRAPETIRDQYNRPLAGAHVYVYNQDGSLATLTIDGTTPLTQPVNTDGFGSYSYWANTGFYTEETWFGGKKLWVEANLAVGSPGADLNLRSDLSLTTGASLVGTATGDTTEAVLSALRRGTGPIFLAGAGQSNLLGANSGGLNPASANVKIWDPITGAWGSSDYTANPLLRAAPDGNGGNNNHVLAAAHFLADATKRKVYLVIDGVGGTSIDLWVASGTSSARYAALKTKIQNALATTQLAGKTTLDLLVWDQGEEDFQRSFATHITSLTTLNTQLRAEAWMSAYTPVFAITLSDLHDRYAIQPALRHFCSKVGQGWRLISAKNLPTSDSTHYTGPALFELGYNRIGPAWLGAHVGELIEPVPYYNRGNGRLAQSDPTAIATYSSLVSSESATDGPGVTDVFDGNNTTGPFTLTSFGTISSITVSGVTKVSPADYSVATAAPTGVSLPVLTFTANTTVGTANVIVTYGSAVNGPAATGTWNFGYRCWANGNYTFAGGYLTRTTNGCNYTLVYGRENVADDGGDYGLVSGFQNQLSNTYGVVFGRGNIGAEDGGAIFGKWATYTTTQTDPVVLQVGVGTSTGARANAFAVRKSGIIEPKTTVVGSLPAAGTAGRRTFVTDATATTFASTVVGGGANKVPVYDNGVAWVIG